MTFLEGDGAPKTRAGREPVRRRGLRGGQCEPLDGLALSAGSPLPNHGTTSALPRPAYPPDGHDVEDGP